MRPRGVVDYVFGNDKPLGPRIQAADLADDRPQDLLDLLVDALVGPQGLKGALNRHSEPSMVASSFMRAFLNSGPRSERTSAGRVLLLRTQRVNARRTSP